MSSTEWWIVLVGCISAVGYVISLEVRLKSVSAKLVQSKQAVSNAQITASAQSMSADALRTDLSAIAGATTGTPSKT